MGSQNPSLNDAANLRRKDRRFSSSAGKVFTSKGLRSRRLRLSAPTAIQFYDVQDRLGCRRPTEAIDWLIHNAKSAIDTRLRSSEAEPHRKKQSLTFPSMATSVPSSFPLENGNSSALGPLISNATPAEFSDQEPPSLGFPSFPTWE